MENFNLSEKQTRDGYENPAYKEEDVKEFIRLLIEYEDKKIGLTKNNFYNKEQKEAHVNCCIDTKIFIKNIAGTKLVGNEK